MNYYTLMLTRAPGFGEIMQHARSHVLGVRAVDVVTRGRPNHFALVREREEQIEILKMLAEHLPDLSSRRIVNEYEAALDLAKAQLCWRLVLSEASAGAEDFEAFSIGEYTYWEEADAREAFSRPREVLREWVMDADFGGLLVYDQLTLALIAPTYDGECFLVDQRPMEFEKVWDSSESE